MGVYIKNGSGDIKKLAGYVTVRQNARWFLCTRTIEDNVEYYTVPKEAETYFKSINAYTIYSLGFNESNTTNTPKLRYGTTVLDIKDFSNPTGQVMVGQLNGVFQMFTQDLATDPKIYFVANTHKDEYDTEMSNTSTNAVQNKVIKAYADNIGLYSHKKLILGADGVGETDVYNFTVNSPETLLEYKKNGFTFLADLQLPITGAIDKTKPVTITFGDTVYYLFNILKGNEHVIIGDLKQVDKYNNETGYRFIVELTYFENADITGFAIIPTVSMSDVLNLTSDEMDKYITEGGLTDGQLAICSKVIANGYDEGGLYRFDITYPSTFTWTKLSGTSEKKYLHTFAGRISAGPNYGSLNFSYVDSDATPLTEGESYISTKLANKLIELGYTGTTWYTATTLPASGYYANTDQGIIYGLYARTDIKGVYAVYAPQNTTTQSIRINNEDTNVITKLNYSKELMDSTLLSLWTPYIKEVVTEL